MNAQSNDDSTLLEREIRDAYLDAVRLGDPQLIEIVNEAMQQLAIDIRHKGASAVSANGQC